MSRLSLVLFLKTDWNVTKVIRMYTLNDRHQFQSVYSHLLRLTFQFLNECPLILTLLTKKEVSHFN